MLQFLNQKKLHRWEAKCLQLQNRSSVVLVSVGFSSLSFPQTDSAQDSQIQENVTRCQKQSSQTKQSLACLVMAETRLRTPLSELIIAFSITLAIHSLNCKIR